MAIVETILWGTRPRKNVRVRFAPSPTGPLHIGGLRTALYNFLFARKHKGTFLLRIDDTDSSRCKPEYAESIVRCLRWAGLRFDEGPVYQSKRLDVYERYCRRLIENGMAYPCFCSAERIQAEKASMTDRPWRYDGKCSRLDPVFVRDRLLAGHRHSVRFRIQQEPVRFDDIVYGRIELNPSRVEGDFIIMRSDGWPTYHLACVVDDHLMEISHVLRGIEWQQSTGKHLQLYRAFKWPAPVFCHLPLIVSDDRKKLSKRAMSKQNPGQLSCRVEDLRRTGIYPEALLSFLTLSGGGGLDRLKRPRLLPDQIQAFAPNLLSKTPGTLSARDLLAENRAFIAQGTSKVSTDLQQLVYEKWYVKLPLEECTKILRVYAGRASFVEDIANEIVYLWNAPALSKGVGLDRYRSSIKEVIAELEKKQDASNLLDISELVASKCGFSHAELLRTIRIIVTGRESGPPLHDLADLMGFERFVDRLSRFLQS